MAELIAFFVLVSMLILAPLLGIRFGSARRTTVAAQAAAGQPAAASTGTPAAWIYVGLMWVGVAFMLVLRYAPETCASWYVASRLALLDPGLTVVPAIGLLVTLAFLGTERNRRAVLALALVAFVYGGWKASDLLRDPAASLGQAKWVDDVLMQSTPWSCAPAAGCALLRQLGIDRSEAQLARDMRTAAHYGTTDFGMQLGLDRVLGAEDHRLRPTLLRGSYDDLLTAGAPALLSIELSFLLNHAVALESIDPGGVVLLDPLRGRRALDRGELEAMWTGRAVTLVPRPPR